MHIEIYGIEEPDYKCYGCEWAKKLCKENGHPYELKRVVYFKDGSPAYDLKLLDELRARHPVGKLYLPYIFVNGKYMKAKEFEALMD